MDTMRPADPPPRFGQAELREMVDALPEECRADVEQGYGNDWLAQARKDREDWLFSTLARIEQKLQLLTVAPLPSPAPAPAESAKEAASDWLMTEQAAELLQWAPKTVRAAAARGDIPCRKWPSWKAKKGRWRYSRQELEAWLRQGRPRRRKQDSDDE